MSDRTQQSGMDLEGQGTPSIKRENEGRNIFEDVVAEENVFQFIGSASGHTTTARSAKAKAYATQCLGDASDTTIQQISKDRSSITVKSQSYPERQTGHFEGRGRTIG